MSDNSYFSKNRVYLDYNSTCFVIPEALEKFITTAQGFYNPSSLHYEGQAARVILEEAREYIKFIINADDNFDLIFTSSGTEANNTVFKGLPEHTAVVSSIEHLSVLNAVYPKGLKIPVDKEGLIIIEALEEILLNLKNAQVLVSVIMVNNETGVIQNIQQISTLVHKYGALLHTDAIQALGKMPINIQELGVDLLTLSSHKIGGGLGAGALIKRKNLNIKPLLLGGGQEKGWRSGTENLPAIAAFSESCKHFQIAQETLRLENLRNYLENSLKEKIPSTIIVSKNAPRVSNTACVIIPGLNNHTQLIYFDLHNISVSIGSACSSGKVSTSHVLSAMGFSEELSQCALRVSLGKTNSLQNIKDLVERWETLYNKSKY